MLHSYSPCGGGTLRTEVFFSFVKFTRDCALLSLKKAFFIVDDLVRYVFFFSIAASRDPVIHFRIHSFLADRPMEIPQQKKVVSYFAKRGGKEIFCHGEGVQNSPGRKIRGRYLFSSECTYFQGNIGKYFLLFFIAWVLTNSMMLVLSFSQLLTCPHK